MTVPQEHGGIAARMDVTDKHWSGPVTVLQWDIDPNSPLTNITRLAYRAARGPTQVGQRAQQLRGIQPGGAQQQDRNGYQELVMVTLWLPAVPEMGMGVPGMYQFVWGHRTAGVTFREPDITTTDGPVRVTYMWPWYDGSQPFWQTAMRLEIRALPPPGAATAPFAVGSGLRDTDQVKAMVHSAGGLP